jgi:PAS domain S-box-containing protein
MSQSTFIGLINNAALLLALCLVYDMLGFRRRRSRKLSIQLLAGAILGGIGLAIMMTPWNFGGGVVFDTRSVLLVICGFFLGTVPTLVAMAITGTFRLFGGGGGVWMGVTVIAVSGLTGLLWRHLRRWDSHPGLIELYLMGIVAHLLMLAATVLLPAGIRGQVLADIALPVLIIYPLTTAILGNLLVHSERRRQGEEELRQSEERYRQLVGNANSIILRLDGSGRIVFANTFATTFFGYQEDELLHRHVVGTIVPATASDGTDLESMIADLFAHPQHYPLHENENIRKDGSSVWVSWTNKAFYDQEGKIAEILCIGTDNSERKKAEIALQESEQNFRTFFASINDMLLIVGRDGRLLMVNEVLQSVAGYTAEELSAMRLGQLFPGEAADTVERLLRGDGAEPAGEHSLQLQAKNGSAIPTSSVFWTGAWNGEVCIYGACRDRRKEIEAEKRFEQLFRHNPALMALTRGDDRTFTDVNDTWLHTTGYSRGEVIGKTATDLDLIPDAAQYQAAVDQLRREGRISDIELTVRRKDGQLLHGLFFGETIIIGTKSHFLTVMLDISERKRMETERRDLESRLQLAHKMEALGTLSGGIAHDFNNILGAVIGYAEMAKEDCAKGTELDHSIEQILKAGMRAKELVQQILAFSRQGSHESQPLRPAPILGETIKLLRASIPTTITIAAAIDKTTPAVLATPTQLHQILMNLCTNAAHAMEDRGGVLTVDLRQVHIDGEDAARHGLACSGCYIRLTVKDDGCGISPEIRERIFDPYFTTKEQGKGTGMGLAIVHGIIHNLGGAISCRSEMGVGTFFEVLLPTMPESAVPEIEDAEAVPGGTERILFVDDEEALVGTSSIMLGRLGYQVTGMSSSQQALATFAAAPDDFDLIITDQTMPLLTGAELAGEVLAMRPGFPILLCTGFSNRISPTRALDMGIKGFLNKPFGKRDIALAIRKLLDSPTSPHA